MHPPDAYHTALPDIPDADRLAALAERVYRQVFRRDFRAPGAALVTFDTAVESRGLRRFLVALKEALDGAHRRSAGRRLVYLSLARFNQQVTTKYHLDGAPDEAFLMLGYEPSDVRSELYIADYTRAAHDLGITPQAYLADHNPMFGPHERRLAPYITPLRGFDPGRANVLVLNNSSLPYRADGANLLGVMHKATILNPMPEESRTVNSTMLGTAADGADEPVPRSALQVFLETQEVAGKIAG